MNGNSDFYIFLLFITMFSNDEMMTAREFVDELMQRPENANEHFLIQKKIKICCHFLYFLKWSPSLRPLIRRMFDESTGELRQDK